MPENALSYTLLPYCCGKKNVPCEYEGKSPAEPCWGPVQMDAVDAGEEGLIAVHACSGHYGCADGGDYTPERK